jgi:hypothetical protein
MQLNVPVSFNNSRIHEISRKDNDFIMNKISKIESNTKFNNKIYVNSF